MATTTKKKTFKERLLDVQTELHAPKDKKNNFGNFKYRSAESILENLKPLLKKNNLILSLNDEIVTTSLGDYIKATATIRDCEDCEELACSALALIHKGKKGVDLAQLTGLTSSYARKYALCGLLLIDDNKDIDELDNTETIAEPTPIVDVNTIREKYAYGIKIKIPSEELLEINSQFGGNLNQLTQEELEEISKLYDIRIDAQKKKKGIK